MKVKSSAGSSCYVMILNHTYNALPQALLNATQPVSKHTESEKVITGYVNLDKKSNVDEILALQMHSTDGSTSTDQYQSF